MSIHVHTPGPWRWEVNEKSKVVQLCGGRPSFDLTVLDFVRWGMGGAQPRFRTSINFMVKAHALTAVIPGREHHADWLKTIHHADARLIEAAPVLLERLEHLVAFVEAGGLPDEEDLAPARIAIAKARGTP